MLSDGGSCPIPVIGAGHSRRLTSTLRTSSRLLDGAAGIGWNDPSSITLGEGGSVVFIQAARVTGDFFRVLGARPMMGRVLTSQDDAAGAENVLVLTHGLWQRRYGGSRDVLGRRETIGGQPFTIVGVMPPTSNTHEALTPGRPSPRCRP